MKKILLLFVPLFLSLTLGAAKTAYPPYSYNGLIQNTTNISFNFTIVCPHKNITGTVGPGTTSVPSTKPVGVSCTDSNITTITAQGIDPKTNQPVTVTGYFAPDTSEQAAGPKGTRQWTITTNKAGYVINAG